MNWFKDIFGALIAPATEWLRQSGERAKIKAEGQVEIARAEVQGEVARAQADATRAAAADEGERAWDAESQRAAQRSWKDELWTLVVALPMVVAFIPGGAGLVATGFQAVSAAPGWYQVIVGASVAFAFGIRQTLNLVRERWK